MHLGVV